MKKILAVVLWSIIFANTVFAKETGVLRGVQDTYLLPKQQTQSIGYAEKDVRGQYIAEGIVEISNMGNGYIGIFAQTMTHKSVDKVKVRVYLDIFDDAREQWVTEVYYDFTYLKEDYPNGDLWSPYEEFKVLGKKNNYYRLRASHMVYLNGETESLNSQTDGLYITN